MFCIVCNYFDVVMEGFNNKCKVEYIDVLSGFVLVCDCNK